MKKLLLIASVLLATSAFADKVGVVDSQRAFFQFSETKKAQQSLEGQAKKVENEARQKEVALQKEYVALQAKGDKLTDAEKEAVKQALVKANPELKEAKITISSTGEATIVYPDGRELVISAEKLVGAKGSNGQSNDNKGTSDKEDSLNVSRENNGASADNTSKSNTKLGQRLANTGATETNTGLAGLGMAILGGLLAARRRKNDKN